MKFTWTVTNECDINIKRCADWVNENIQEDFDRYGRYPDEDPVTDYATDMVLEALDREGYTENEVPKEVLTKMCKEVLKYVYYQTAMNLEEEEEESDEGKIHSSRHGRY